MDPKQAVPLQKAFRCHGPAGAGKDVLETVTYALGKRGIAGPSTIPPSLAPMACKAWQRAGMPSEWT